MGLSLGSITAIANPSAWLNVASTAAGIGGDIYSARQASKQAAKNRDFQERMSSTAHQREVADLRAAGLNPILSGTGGAGSSSPSGAVAQVPDYGSTAQKGINSALNLKLAQAQIDSLNAGTKKTEAERYGVLTSNQILEKQAGYIGTEQSQKTAEYGQRMANLREELTILQNKTVTSGVESKTAERDFERLADQALWTAKNAGQAFTYQRIEELIRNDKLSWQEKAAILGSLVVK